jgi:hypothetical protein
LIAWPESPLAVFGLVMTGVPDAIVIVTAFDPVPAGLIAFTVTGKVPPA